MLSRELKTESIRLAVLLSDLRLLIIVRAAAWLLKGTQAVKAHQIDEALAYLGEPEMRARVRTTIRELGGIVFSDGSATG